MDDLFAKSLPMYSPEQQESLRGIQDEIKQYTQSDGATEKQVLTVQDKASELEAESARLYSLLNPSLPPISLPSMVAATLCVEEGSTLEFSSAETFLRHLLTVAKNARIRVQEAAETVAARKQQVEAIELKRKQAQKAQELSALFKEEADKLCREEEDLQKEIDALQDQCMDVEAAIQKKLNLPPPLQKIRLTYSVPETHFSVPVGGSAAKYAEMELSQAMHTCKEQRDRAQKAKDKLPELMASKKDTEDRLRALKLRLDQLNGQKRGADVDVDCATPAKTSKVEAAASAL